MKNTEQDIWMQTVGVCRFTEMKQDDDLPLVFNKYECTLMLILGRTLYRLELETTMWDGNRFPYGKKPRYIVTTNNKYRPYWWYRISRPLW